MPVFPDAGNKDCADLYRKTSVQLKQLAVTLKIDRATDDFFFSYRRAFGGLF
jgi:hypothetical protein